MLQSTVVIDDTSGMEHGPHSSGVEPSDPLERVIHRVNNALAVMMTESELAVLTGTNATRVRALRSVVKTAEELKNYLLAEQQAALGR